MIVWTAINSAAILLVMFALFLTIRQVGLLLGRMGPVGARTGDMGPRIGENLLPHVEMIQEPGTAPMKPTLYLFATTFCPACRMVREAAPVVARSWRSAALIAMVYDEPPELDRREGLPANFIVTSQPGVREAIDVRAVPYGVMTDARGFVVGHGLVNSASHIESLLELVGNPDVPAEPSGPATAAHSGHAEPSRERIHA
jgi:methylamine dehydrogenase accessory protein MauD